MNKTPLTGEFITAASLRTPDVVAEIAVNVICNTVYCGVTPYNVSKPPVFFKIMVEDLERPDADTFSSVSVIKTFTKQETSVETITCTPSEPTYKDVEQKTTTNASLVLKICVKPLTVRSTADELACGSDTLMIDLVAVQHYADTPTQAASYLGIYIEGHVVFPAKAVGIVKCTSKILTMEQFDQETQQDEKTCNHDWQLGVANFPSP